MKQKQFELPECEELGAQEMKAIHGGLSISPAWWAVIWNAVNNFGDIRQGFSDGFSGKPPRY
jgi:hypothetical protein